MRAKKILLREIEIIESSIQTIKITVHVLRSVLRDSEDVLEESERFQISNVIASYLEDIKEERDQIKKLQKDIENLAA